MEIDNPQERNAMMLRDVNGKRRSKRSSGQRRQLRVARENMLTLNWKAHVLQQWIVCERWVYLEPMYFGVYPSLERLLEGCLSGDPRPSINCEDIERCGTFSGANEKIEIGDWPQRGLSVKASGERMAF
jgi:hypothetical protein